MIYPIESTVDDLERNARTVRYLNIVRNKTIFTLAQGITALRQELRVAKQYAVADALRKILTEAGLEVRDTPFGSGQLTKDAWGYKKEPE